MNSNDPEYLEIPQPDDGGIPRRDIKSVKKLPKWFDLNNYRDAGLLSASDWYNELNIRAMYYSLVDIYEDIDWSHNLPSSKDLNTKKHFFGSRDVYTEELNELYDYAANNIDCYINKNGKYFSGLITKSDDIEKLINKEPLMTLDMSAVFKTNLLTPDTNLIAQFKIWLINERNKLATEIRENKNGKTEAKRSTQFNQVITNGNKILQLNKRTFISWHTCGLLPFIDLHQWALTNNFKIEQDVYSEAVLLNKADSGSSRIGDSTYSKANFVMQYIELLWNQLQTND